MIILVGGQAAQGEGVEKTGEGEEYSEVRAQELNPHHEELLAGWLAGSLAFFLILNKHVKLRPRG